ncbi:MAG: hypothetical protein H6719_05130 [Sandaracinaceae bacterium]|nr:hypothetical protein [Sandaracinaceae bacterium]
MRRAIILASLWSVACGSPRADPEPPPGPDEPPTSELPAATDCRTHDPDAVEYGSAALLEVGERDLVLHDNFHTWSSTVVTVAELPQPLEELRRGLQVTELFVRDRLDLEAPDQRERLRSVIEAAEAAGYSTVHRCRTIDGQAAPTGALHGAPIAE